MNAAAALPLLHGLLDEWTVRGQLLAAQGAEPDILEDVLAEHTTEPAGAAAVDPADRDAARQARINQVAGIVRVLR